MADSRTYAHAHQAQRFALLRRMLTCGHCGSSILPAWTKNHGRQYRYYVCSRRLKTGYDNCPLPSIPAAELERVVVDQLRDVFRQPEMIAAAIKQIATKPATSVDLDSVQSALQRLDSVWELLYPEEQRRILELLVESITVSQAEVSLRLRFHGIEQIVGEVA